MTSIQRFAGRFAASAVIALSFTLTCRANADGVAQVIRVLQIKGHARYSADIRTWQPVKRGDVLPPGILIQTAQKSAVDLQLGDENAAPAAIDSPNGTIRSPDELKANTIRVFENSVLGIGKLTSVRAGEAAETQLDLRAGRIMGAVRKTTNPSRYEIKFSTGVAGVRDGVYLLNFSGALDVLYGTTLIALESADVKIVMANHEFDPSTGVVAQIRSPLPIEPLDAGPKNASAAATRPLPPFQGQGMGGSLRKF